MPKAKNDIQDMSINEPQQNISVKITFYFNILNRLFLRITPMFHFDPHLKSINTSEQCIKIQYSDQDTCV